MDAPRPLRADPDRVHTTGFHGLTSPYVFVMPQPNPHRPFRPDPAQLEVTPEVSGNTINGLHETEARRPRMVYWAPDPTQIPHGGLQFYFYGRSDEVPAFEVARQKRSKIINAPLPDVAPAAVEHAPEEWTAALHPFVDAGVCEMTGVADMIPDWVFEGYEVTQSKVIMIGVQHAYDEIAKAPDAAAGLEVMHQYGRAATAAKTIAGWIRERGWDAEAVTGPMTGALAMIPPALACGFGELGKHGSIINPDLGASFRLSAVLTDAPFATTPAQTHGIDDFCKNCRICAIGASCCGLFLSSGGSAAC